MTPVMERCPCDEAFPVAECTRHEPSIDTSGLVLDGPPVVVTLTVGAVALAGLIVITVAAVIAWGILAVMRRLGR